MTNFYVDPENGNDGNTGLSFAQRLKTFTFLPSAGLAAGDTVRIIGSPDPVDTGIDGTWRSEFQYTPKNIVSSTNATPIVVTVTAHGYSNGDLVAIRAHTTNTDATGPWVIANVTADTFELVGSVGNGVGGATGFVTNISNAVVTLSSALTQNIACTGQYTADRGTWTANTNVTTSITSVTDTKEGRYAEAVTIATGFATGVSAYCPTGALNLSGYQGVAFWIRQVSGLSIIVDGDMELVLSTDATGTAAVHHIPIPALGSVGFWTPVYWDNGSALDSAIQSVALNVLVDRGSCNVLLSNIIAVKAAGADCLHFNKLIGKNAVGETFYAIQSINGTRLILDNAPAANPASTNTIRGYTGTSETVALWARETVKTPLAAAGAVLTLTENGTAGNPITYSGGWNRTDMSTQTLETWLDGRNGNGNAFVGTSRVFNAVENMAFVRYALATSFGGVIDCVLDLIAVNNNTQGCSFAGTAHNRTTTTIGFVTNNSSTAVSMAGGLWWVDVGKANNNANSQFVFSSTMNGNLVVGEALNNGSGVVFNFSGSYHCRLQCGDVSLIGGVSGAAVNLSGGGNNQVTLASVFTEASACVLNTSHDNHISQATLSSGVAGVSFTTGSGKLFLNDVDVQATEVIFASTAAFSNGGVYSQNHDKTAYNHQQILYGGTIGSATDQRHTASGISWKFNPTNTTRDSLFPLTLALGKIAILANVLTTVGLWCRRDDTDIKGLLVVRGGQAAGIPSDATTACEPAINTWVRYTVNVTPTENCVVEVEFHVWDGVDVVNSFWVDDMTVT